MNRPVREPECADRERAAREVLGLETRIYADQDHRRDIAKYLASDFWEVSENGDKTDRATVLEHLAASPVIIDEYPVDDARVQVFGNVAISTGRSVLKARVPQPDGTERPLIRSTRFVHVWVHEAGVWQTVYAHNSTAPEPS